MTTNIDFHEVWWIYAQGDHEWCGLRIAHFRKSANDGTEIVYITGEIDRNRIGPRIWNDINGREGWRKVKQIAIPSRDEVAAALKVS